ncbi:S8 family serine peptidase [Actinomadura oligospora]|uniref:S8 family serine peptidase n=1 Tax=Actinomadura oligospora TaxID=111804 RepID=UPI0004B23EE1|nr:S8 family serine peptidase [Actinomadura oligospora]
MRRLTRSAAAATAAVGLAVIPTASAGATPNPSAQEWWFKGWSIQQQVWPLTKGQGVTVAVLDSGVNGNLPDMKPATLQGTDVVSGGNGWKDHDEQGHGTAIASVIASRGTSTGFVGIAPEAKILPVRTQADGPYLSKAIRFAVDHGAKVVNMSVGNQGATMFPNQCPPEVFSAIRYAIDKDVVLVGSAGNTGDEDNAVEYPGSCPGVVAVGALGRDGHAWKKSQRQPYVAVGAPGVDVGGLSQTGHVWTTGEGTSQASALTAGAVALIRAKFPQMKAREVVQLLTNTTKDFGSPDQLGRGVISIPRALRTKVPASAPNPVFARYDKAVAQAPKGSGGGSGSSSAPAEEKKGSSSTMLYVGIGVVVIVVLVVGGVVLMRRGKGKGGAGAPPPAPMGPPSFGQQPGGQTGPQRSPYASPQQPGGFGQPGGQPGGPHLGGQPGNGAPQFQPPAGGQDPRQ